MNGGFLSSLTFLHPWILAGLLALPVLWWILRVTPPAPRRQDFPAARLLAGLIPERSFPSRTPWWILLLRLSVAALVLLALSHPVRDAGQALDGKGPLRLVIDNGWEAAQSWPSQTRAARDLITRAGREGRSVMLLTTAPPADGGPLAQSGPASAGTIDTLLRGLTVQPWPADYDAAAKAAEGGGGKDISTVWLSSGVANSRAEGLVQILKTQGTLSVLTPAPGALPLLLRPPESNAGKALSARVVAPEAATPGLPVTVQALDTNGRVLDAQSVRLAGGGKASDVTFDIPDTLRNAATRIRIAGRQGAGAIVLIDETFRRRTVGLVESGGESGGKTPFIGADYYLSRALSPYAEIVQGPVDAVLKNNPSLILLPDIGAMPPGMLDQLQNWVRAGGTLARFAGPKMAASPESFLTPVPLRSGGRAQGGAMSWDKPLHLAPFAEESPLRDLSVPKDVVVRQQVLADSSPSQDMKNRVWMQLEDGTPLVTAAAEGKGMIILVHTTATPEWSDLALSGLFVDMLRKFVAMSAAPSALATGQNAAAADIFQPEQVLDGQGGLTRPGPSVSPLSVRDFPSALPSPSHPPGFYGASGVSRAFNLGANIRALGALPTGLVQTIYDSRHETDLMPWLLAAALLLFLVDWGLMAALDGGLRAAGGRFPLPARLKTRKAAKSFGDREKSRRRLLLPLVMALSVFGASCLFQSPAAHAAAGPENPTRLASGFYLAYVRSGSESMDSLVEKGLAALGEVLRTRTSVEPAGVIGVDPETDDLSFFPLLYWPINREAAPLSDKGLGAVQFYLNHGGTILFDTRDSGIALNGFGNTPGTLALRRIVGALDIPPLVPVPKTHVLTRSFYLLNSFPGRYSDGTLWAESQSVSGRDGVSSVLIGGNDWAAVWAESAQSGYPTPQQEMSLRFGVNLVMYALTGNYKADQVHIPYILERLGRQHP